MPTDIRDDAAVAAAVQAALERFGGIDILVNNASAIRLTSTASTPMKRFDLMLDVNVRGTFACTQACLPALTRSGAAGRNPHVLALSPPPQPLAADHHCDRGFADDPGCGSQASQTAEIMADAAWWILTSDARSVSGASLSMKRCSPPTALPTWTGMQSCRERVI